MKHVISFCLGLILLGATCTTASADQWLVIAQFDITGDQVIDQIQIKDSNIKLDSDLESSYAFDFSELKVVGADDKILLQVTTEGIISEDGTKLKPVITTQVAYALGFGKQLTTHSQNDSLFYIVQIDSAGKAVSEPITLNWNTNAQTWVIGK